MWKLIYEDTFGFGEDREPSKIEFTGENYIDGFYKLWISMLNESIIGTSEIAGKNMAGNILLEYNHLPFFYSDLFDFRYETVGELNSKFEIVEKW